MNARLIKKASIFLIYLPFAAILIGNVALVGVAKAVDPVPAGVGDQTGVTAAGSSATSPTTNTATTGQSGTYYIYAANYKVTSTPTVPNNASTGTASLYFGVNNPNGEAFEIRIVEISSGKLIKTLEGGTDVTNGANTGAFSYPVQLPYSQVVQVQLWAPDSTAAGDTTNQPTSSYVEKAMKAFNISIAVGGADQASFPLDVDPSKTTVAKNADGSYALAWGLNRTPTATETLSVGVIDPRGVMVATANNVKTINGTVSFQDPAITASKYKIPFVESAQAIDAATAWKVVTYSVLLSNPITANFAANSLVSSFQTTPTASNGTAANGTGGTTTAAGSSSGTATSGGSKQPSMFGNLTGTEYFNSVYLWAIGIAFSAAVISIIYAGYKYVMSQGEPAKISEAKELIISALTGIALLILAGVVLNALGIQL